MLSKCLLMYSIMHGKEGDLLFEFFTYFLMKMNSHALKMLNQGNIEVAFQVLLKCQEIYKRTKYKFNQAMIVLTMNHMACCYQQIGHPKVSQRILDDATQLLHRKHILDFRGITYLNRCAVLGLLGNHERALENARIASDCFEKEILELPTGDDIDEMDFRKEFMEKVKLLTLCYYNLSIEAEIIGNIDACTQAIKQALKLYYFFIEDDVSMKPLFRKLIAHDQKVTQSRNREQVATIHGLISRAAIARMKATQREEEEDVSIEELVNTIPSGDLQSKRPTSSFAKVKGDQSLQQSKFNGRVTVGASPSDQRRNPLKLRINLFNQGDRAPTSAGKGMLRNSIARSPSQVSTPLLSKTHKKSNTEKIEHSPALTRRRVEPGRRLMASGDLSRTVRMRDSADGLLLKKVGQI